MAIGYFISEEQFDSTNPNHRCGDGNGDGVVDWYMEIRHIGCVVEISEKNGRDDSDFFATYWDVASETFKTEMYGTTRGWCYPVIGVTQIDVAPEIKMEWNRLQEYNRKIVAITNARWDKMKIEHTIIKGSTVRVEKGRKVKPGFEGQVFWIGSDNFSGKTRLGIKNSDGDKVFVAAEHCKVMMSDGGFGWCINDAMIGQRYDGPVSKMNRVESALEVSYFQVQREVAKEMAAQLV